MSCVFQNIDPPPPSPLGECVPLGPAPPLLRGEDTLAGWRGGWRVNILEDARHSSVLYLYRILFGFHNERIFKLPFPSIPAQQSMGARNQVGIGLSYWSAWLHRLVELIP